MDGLYIPYVVGNCAPETTQFTCFELVSPSCVESKNVRARVPTSPGDHPTGRLVNSDGSRYSNTLGQPQISRKTYLPQRNIRIRGGV